ncbi:glycosyltransferase [Hoyosella sp. YIM 151337]|uniref:glycosyltransferase n=1 Tax=Hoyosella sp. YIM 151337 TaxID=2992742 RepID=UPI0022367222|nr:glycosyltransferase [Hoyosella sp. YIM 151337]MCW4355517.1 glycosyltransferase [Hoyosella sp. YIM 151337]
MTAFVSGSHRYVIPAGPGGGQWLRGRAGRAWPATAIESSPAALASEQIDLVVVQRPEELALTEVFLGRRPGLDVPAVYVEHNAPRPGSADAVHPLAQSEYARDIPLVHVTHFNRVMWDNGPCQTFVVEHGIADPGVRYRGDLPRMAAMINEPGRRARVTGSDMLRDFGAVGPVDLFGMGSQEFAGAVGGGITGKGDLAPPALHQAVARRRVYVHTARWTSLGLSLVEAMYMGMPVVVFAATEAASVIPPEAGCVSSDVGTLTAAAEGFMHDREMSGVAGKTARQYAQARFGLDRYLADWDVVFAEVVARQ